MPEPSLPLIVSARPGSSSTRQSKISLQAVVVGVLCFWFLDSGAILALLKGSHDGWSIFGWTSALIVPERIACQLIDGALSGVVVSAVCTHRLVAHLVVCWLLVNMWNLLILVPLVVISPILLTTCLGHACGLVASIVSGLAAERFLGLRLRKVILTGLGDTWEPRSNTPLAVLFSICILIEVVPDVVLLRGLVAATISTTQDAQNSFKQLSAAPSNKSSEALNLFLNGTFFGVMGTAGAIGIMSRMLIFVAPFISLLRRCFPPKASAALSRDTHSVLWLRPFEIDGLPVGVALKRDLIFGPWKNLCGATLEQKINRCFCKSASLIAIGKPGERLPHVGAARLYVDHSQWQSVVAGIMHHGDGVILHAAESAGTLWEWQTAISQIPRTRIILCLPVSGPSHRRRETIYQKIKTNIEKSTGVLIPEHVDKRTMFAFFPTLSSTRAVWINRRNRLPEAHPLAPSLQRLRKLRLPLVRASPLGVVVLSLLLVAVISCFIWLVRDNATKNTHSSSQPVPNVISIRTIDVPNAFEFEYRFPPDPGTRSWQRNRDGTWTETTSNGALNHFEETSSESIPGAGFGIVVTKIAEPNFQVFIPSRSAKPRVYFRHRTSGNASPWQLLAPLTTPAATEKQQDKSER